MTNEDIDIAIEVLTEMVHIYSVRLDILRKQRRIDIVPECRLHNRIEWAIRLIEDLKQIKK